MWAKRRKRTSSQRNYLRREFTRQPSDSRRWRKGKARLRAIVTATHKRSDLERACEILAEVAKPLGII